MLEEKLWVMGSAFRVENMDETLMDKAGESSPIQRHSADEQPLKIRERAFAFSVRAVKLYQHLQMERNGAGWVIGRQFLRTACSVGANIEEAQAAECRADPSHKLGVAQKEARETLYWLRLPGESQVVAKPKFGPLMKEAEVLTRVLSSIILTTKNGRARGVPKNS